MDVRFLFDRPDPKDPNVTNTTKSIAERLGLDPSTVHRWKKDGSHPDGKSLGLLLKYGYLTADDLTRGGEDAESIDDGTTRSTAATPPAADPSIKLSANPVD